VRLKSKSEIPDWTGFPARPEVHMPPESRRRLRIATLLAVLALCAAFALAARAEAPSGLGNAGEAVYVAAFRTPAHVNRSTPEVFHHVVDAVLDLLKSQRVPLASDPSRPMIQTAETMPVATLLNAAKDAGAAYLLVLTVNRPAISWLKVSLQAFDMSGQPLWEEHAAYGAGVNSGKAFQDVMGKISKQLEPRFGKPGLPLAQGDPPA
jgi:hypothetical protein